MLSHLRMSRFMLARLSAKPVSEVKTAARNELLRLAYSTFKQENAESSQIKKLGAEIDALLTLLSPTEIKMLIQNSHDSSLLLSIKENLLDKLVAAKILDKVRFLFKEEAAILYSNEAYYRVLVMISSELLKLGKLTETTMATFLASEDSFAHVEQIKRVLTLMQNRELAATDHHVHTLLLFPSQALLIAEILMRRNQEISEERYCALIQDYFNKHVSDVTPFGFNQALLSYLREWKEEASRKNQQMLWQGVHETWRMTAYTDAPQNMNRRLD